MVERLDPSHVKLIAYLPDFSLVAFQGCDLVARERLVHQDLSRQMDDGREKDDQRQCGGTVDTP